MAISAPALDTIPSLVRPQTRYEDRRGRLIHMAFIHGMVASFILSVCEFSGVNYGTEDYALTYQENMWSDLKWPILAGLVGIDFWRNIRAGVLLTPVTVLFGIFWLIGTMGALVNYGTNMTNDGIMRSGLYGMVLAMGLLSRHDAEWKRRQWVVAVMWMTTYVVIMSLIYFIIGLGFFKGRLRGVTVHPNQISQFSGICLAYWYSRFTHKPALITGLITLAPLVTLLLSNSRTGLLSGTVIILAVPSIYYLATGGARHLALLITIGVVGVIAFSIVFAHIEHREFELSNRQDIWLRQLESIVDRPLFGLGFAAENKSASGGYMVAEGSPLTIASASGLLGFAGFYGFIVLAGSQLIQRVLHGLRHAPDRTLPQLVGLAMSLFILTASISESFFVRLGNIPFYILAMILLYGSAEHYLPNQATTDHADS